MLNIDVTYAMATARRWLSGVNRELSPAVHALPANHRCPQKTHLRRLAVGVTRGKSLTPLFCLPPLLSPCFLSSACVACVVPPLTGDHRSFEAANLRCVAVGT